MRVCFWLMLFCLCVGVAQAQTEKLRVGIFERAPFATKAKSGAWTGLAVEVWEQAAAEIGAPFDYVEVSPDEALARAARGELDVVIDGTGVSPERARMVDFTQPYLSCPAAVAMLRRTHSPSWSAFVADVLAHGVGVMLLVLLVAMVVFSALLWLIERRVDSTHFGGRPWHGIGSALWFAAVTLTTVGYGDKTPRSPLGRFVVFFFMFFGVVAVSVFAGTVASSLSLARVDSQVNHPRDLVRYRNGVLDGSIAQSALKAAGVPAKTYPTVSAGLHGLQTGEITAFLGGEIALRYAVHRDAPGEIVVLPLLTTRENYAFALRPDLPQRKAINVAVVGIVDRPEWQQQIERWIGPPVRQ